VKPNTIKALQELREGVDKIREERVMEALMTKELKEKILQQKWEHTGFVSALEREGWELSSKYVRTVKGEKQKLSLHYYYSDTFEIDYIGKNFSISFRFKVSEISTAEDKVREIVKLIEEKVDAH
jgi:hypothetical protein